MSGMRGVLEYHDQQGHTAADLLSCPVSAEAAHHSSLSDIYDEAG